MSGPPDDALARLEKITHPSSGNATGHTAFATVRDELQRLREEIRVLRRGYDDAIAGNRQQLEAFQAAEAALAEATKEWRTEKEWRKQLWNQLEDMRRERDETYYQAVAAEAALADMRRALERISEQQPITVEWLRANGIVFDGPLGTDPNNWQHVAFSIYTDVCEMDTEARRALAAADGTPECEHYWRPTGETNQDRCSLCGDYRPADGTPKDTAMPRQANSQREMADACTLHVGCRAGSHLPECPLYGTPKDTV